MNFIVKHGWKAFGVLLLSYVLVMGLRAPIAPSINDVSPDDVSTYQKVQLRIHTKNTSLTKKDLNISAYVISNDKALKSDSLSVINDTTLLAKFTLAPWLLPVSSSKTLPDLIVNTDYDGNMVLRSALSLKAMRDDTTLVYQGAAPITNITVAHTTPQYFSYPMREILYQSVRNLFFHVPMWFAMLVVFSISCYYSIFYLRTSDINYDIKAQAYTLTGIIFGIAGLLTGSQWARATWGAWWTGDTKLNGAAISMLMYLAYTVLRGNFDDHTRRARVSAVYNIFAYAMLFPLLFILPRLADSLHPGNGGNPGFNTYDLDGNMRKVFYPAAAGWIILSLWIGQLTYRIQKLKASID